MKKIIIAMIVSVVIIGSVIAIQLFKNHFDKIINCISSPISCYVGDTFCVKSEKYLNISSKGNLESVVFSSDNASIISVNAISGVVKCLKKGTANIKTYYRANDELIYNCSVAINVIESPIYPTSISFDKQNIILSPNSNVINNLNMVGECNQQFVVESSNSNIATYDLENKQIKSFSIGECVIRVTVGNISTECNVKVQNFSYQINITDRIVITNNSSIVSFSIEVNDCNCSDEVTLEYDNTLITVEILDNSLFIQKLKVGECDLKIKLKANENAYKLIRIVCT